MQDKLKNWEELCNDGENYAGEGDNLSPKEKILFENIKDKKVTIIEQQDKENKLNEENIDNDEKINQRSLTIDKQRTG